MYEVYAAILHCAEYNFEKLIKYRGKPKSPEEFLCWKLEFGIGNCVGFLLMCEKYHWNVIKCPDSRNATAVKKAPVKLRKRLAGLLNSFAPARTEYEQLMKFREGISKTVKYLQNIKDDENYLNSKALRDVYEHLESLLELKISPLPGGLLMK
jgi:hypothetical protein